MHATLAWTFLISTTSSLCLTKEADNHMMKKSIAKAAEFLRKAAAALRGKAGTLRARLLFLASLRRRAAVLARISRQIRALSPDQRGQEKGDHGDAAAVDLSRPAEFDDDGEFASTTPAGKRDGAVVIVGMAELARLFREVDEDGGDDGGCCQDWTLALRSLFDDDGDGNHGYGDDDLDGVEEGVDDDDEEEPSMIDIIRSRREGEGREFKIDDEIDQATDMFITRVRRRIGAQHPELNWRPVLVRY